jgi:hypothetical protein
LVPARPWERLVLVRLLARLALVRLREWVPVRLREQLLARPLG